MDNEFLSGMFWGAVLLAVILVLLAVLFGNGDMNRTCEAHGYDSKKHISNEWYCMDSGDEPRIIKMEVLEKMEVCDGR